eukprot:m.618183 g.618183  ORF g.618183 m.618183 type:complete len:50 (+) comp22527_c1_seq5:1102-1251(+)
MEHLDNSARIIHLDKVGALMLIVDQRLLLSDTTVTLIGSTRMLEFYISE